MDYYLEFLELLKKSNVEYDELYINDESIGTFFSVYPFKNMNQLNKYEMTGVGYLHIINKKNIRGNIINQLKETNKYILKENDNWWLIFRNEI
ncbi:MAG: hypothetical protein Q7R95_06790, partial [bacterium]|nr:hypothetical protein [bacterium]